MILKRCRDILAVLGRALYDAMCPEAVLRAQAVAFMMFLAFFPALLFLVGTVAWLLPGWQGLLGDLAGVIPPGSRRAVLESLRNVSVRPEHLLLVGGLGTLVLGTQLMNSLTQVFGSIYGRTEENGFWKSQVRSLGVVVVTVVPWVVLAFLIVFGRIAHSWISEEVLPEASALMDWIWHAGYLAMIFLTSALVIGSLYHYLTPNDSVRWRNVLPGAGLAMILWWVVTTGFGLYVRTIAIYNAIYGGFAAAIGLLIWMFLTSLVLLIGAKFNAGMLAVGKEQGGGN